MAALPPLAVNSPSTTSRSSYAVPVSSSARR